MELSMFVIISIFIANLVNGSTAESDGDTNINDVTANDVTTEPEYPIRRRIPLRSSGGGSRLALINSRFVRRPKPKKKNLDRDQLLELLGDYFDPNWMSIEEPSALSKPNKGSTYVYRRDGWQYVELTNNLRLSNLSIEIAQLASNEDPAFVTAIEKYLVRKATCPVRYFWEDIGTMFWPRYIRRGECPVVPGTCSWPQGMHCVPSGTTNLHVLRWQCKAVRGKGRRRQFKIASKKDWSKRIDSEQTNLKCHWIRVPYPITSNCLCTC